VNCTICSHVLAGPQHCTELCGLGERVARDLKAGKRPSPTAGINPETGRWEEPPPPQSQNVTPAA
jgi:hypothetical protein